MTSDRYAATQIENALKRTRSMVGSPDLRRKIQDLYNYIYEQKSIDTKVEIDGYEVRHIYGNYESPALHRLKRLSPGENIVSEEELVSLLAENISERIINTPESRISQADIDKLGQHHTVEVMGSELGLLCFDLFMVMLGGKELKSKVDKAVRFSLDVDMEKLVEDMNERRTYEFEGGVTMNERPTNEVRDLFEQHIKNDLIAELSRHR